MFSENLGDSQFIVKSKYENIVGIGSKPKDAVINYALELKKYPPQISRALRETNIALRPQQC